VLETTPTFVAGGAYTVLAVGPFASIEPLVLTDDNAAGDAGTARLRALHVAPSGATLDVYVTAPGADLATSQPAIPALSFKSASAYVSLPAGQYQIRLTQSGAKTVELDAGTFTFGGGEVHSVYILDTAGGGTPLTVTSLRDA
jgi:hypothetical protein